MARARATILILAAAIAAAACGGQPGPAERQAGPAPAARPPALYSVGDQLFGLAGRGRVRLQSAPVAPLAGWLTPAAVPSPDGRYVAYNAWRELRPDDPRLSWEDQGIEWGDALATPSLRVYDVSLGEDTLLEEGAFSLAWRADGVLAYFKGAARDYRAGVRYVGDVLVRSSLAASPKVWTPEPGRYVVVAWAGSRLVAYREHEGEALDVVVLDGPGRMRVVAPGAGLVAVSPDGRRLFVEEGPAHGRPAVRVLDVADGRELAALDLTAVDPAVGAVSYAGDWSGELVVASSASGLAVFRVAGDEIALAQALRFDLRDSESGAAEPRFADPGGQLDEHAGRRRLPRLRARARTLRTSRSRARGRGRGRVPAVAPPSLQPEPPAGRSAVMGRLATLAACLLAFSATPAGAADGWWTFDRDTNLDSTLRWKWTYPEDPRTYSKSWRAGSGTSQNECRRAEGWLPAGWYAQWGHWNRYDGSAIKGRVWWVQDKYCWDGVTKRTELFIHSEETASNGQSCTSTWDDPFCWEREADYYSLGCIKLSRPSPVADFPNSLGSAHRYYHDHGGSSGHGDLRNDSYELYVYS